MAGSGRRLKGLMGRHLFPPTKLTSFSQLSINKYKNFENEPNPDSNPEPNPKPNPEPNPNQIEGTNHL